jgi:hypothetical protein
MLRSESAKGLSVEAVSSWRFALIPGDVGSRAEATSGIRSSIINREIVIAFMSGTL